MRTVQDGAHDHPQHGTVEASQMPPEHSTDKAQVSTIRLSAMQHGKIGNAGTVDSPQANKSKRMQAHT